jgi:hypothetical protein
VQARSNPSKDWPIISAIAPTVSSIGMAGSSRAGVCRRTGAAAQTLQVNPVALLLVQGEPAPLRAGQVREDAAG